MNTNPRRKDVFILGAGFSKSISPQMPLMADLTRRLLSEKEFAQWQDFGNFEEVMTFLSERAPWEEQSSSLRKRADFLDLSKLIGEVIREAQGEGTDFSGVLIEWAEVLHQNKIPIISLNYDLLLERLFAHSKIPTAKYYPIALAHALSRDGVGLLGSEKKPNVPTIYKLHGSVSWFYSGGESFFGETIYHVPVFPTTMLNSNEALLDKIPLIVPPTLHKTTFFKSETIETLWQLAGLELLSAECLIAIGYSLPQTDALMNFFLKARATGIKEVHIVDPCSLPVENFRKAIARADVEFHHHGGEDAVQNFIELYLKSR